MACSPLEVAELVKSKRLQIRECCKNGDFSPELRDMGIHSTPTYDKFKASGQTDGDYLMYLSDQVHAGKMGVAHTVAHMVDPFSKERVYATASDFAGLQPLQPQQSDTFHLVKQDVWESMSAEERDALAETGECYVTQLPANTVSRTCGDRNVVNASDCGSNRTCRACSRSDCKCTCCQPGGTCSAQRTVQCTQSHCDCAHVNSGPRALVEAIGAQWHEDHWCCKHDARSVSHKVSTTCTARGIKAGVVIAPIGRKCPTTISEEHMQDLVDRLFPEAVHDLQELKTLTHATQNTCNLTAVMPTEKDNRFHPVPHMRFTPPGSTETLKETGCKAKFDGKAWTVSVAK
jgi:hypothetical protein